MLRRVTYRVTSRPKKEKEYLFTIIKEKNLTSVLGSNIEKQIDGKMYHPSQSGASLDEFLQEPWLLCLDLFNGNIYKLQLYFMCICILEI